MPMATSKRPVMIVKRVAPRTNQLKRIVDGRVPQSVRLRDDDEDHAEQERCRAEPGEHTVARLLQDVFEEDETESRQDNSRDDERPLQLEIHRSNRPPHARTEHDDSTEEENKAQNQECPGDPAVGSAVSADEPRRCHASSKGGEALTRITARMPSLPTRNPYVDRLCSSSIWSMSLTEPIFCGKCGCSGAFYRHAEARTPGACR